MSSLRELDQDQSGIVAFVVTMLIMLILTLTTLGMAQLARREQRQGLDRILGVQAFYAAESGVNDVLDRIHRDPAFIPSNLTTCGIANTINNNIDTASIPYGNKMTLTDNASSVLGNLTTTSQYVCALVDEQPASLEYSQVPPDKGIVADMTIASSASKLVIGWEDYQGGAQFRTGGSCGQFDSATGLTPWSSAPLLKVDITNLAAGFDRTTMQNNTASYYLDPCISLSPPGTVTFSGGFAKPGNASIISGDCSTATPHTRTNTQPLRCNVVVGLSSDHLLVRLKPLYGTARVSMLALDMLDKPLRIAGAQTVIDVTGKASDVVKRMQVRTGNSVPYLYAVESAGAVCKRLQVVPSPTPTTADTITGIVGMSSSDQNICKPSQP